MLSLKSPKINVGMHCLKLRTKSMYINPVVDADEAALYDARTTTLRTGASRLRLASDPTASRFEQISAAANAAAANYDVFRQPRQTKLVKRVGESPGPRNPALLAALRIHLLPHHPFQWIGIIDHFTYRVDLHR